MKVSIIVPCYNAEAYLENCLQSIFMQDMPDFEVLLLDDGSTDGTLAIAQHAAAQDARVRVISQINQGVCAARNAGLDCAQGEFVTFVDADDLLTPDALRCMLSAAWEGVDLVICPHETFDAKGYREIICPQTHWMHGTPAARRHAAARRLIEGDAVLNIMCGKLHRRAHIEQEGIRLVPGLTMAEDALFNLEAVLCAREIAYVPHVTYCYRMHAQSVTHRQVDSEWQTHLPWLCAMQTMLLRRGEMEHFYAAYVDSAVLRLYKDGGVSGVVHEFKPKAQSLLTKALLDAGKMRLDSRMVHMLCQNGMYPAVYPFLYPFQVIARKQAEVIFALRARKEKTACRPSV